MKRRAAVGIVVVFAAFPSCSTDATLAFCEAARDLANFDKETADLDELRASVERLVDAAPGDIEDSAREFGEGIEAVLTGDFENASGARFAEAGDEIQEYTDENCDGSD